MRIRVNRTCSTLCVAGALLLGPSVHAQVEAPSKPSAAKPAQPSASPEVTLPMRLVDGVPVVHATINGKGPYRLAIDTTADEVQLDGGLLVGLGAQLKTLTRQSDSPDGRSYTVITGAVDFIALGDVTFRNITAVAHSATGGSAEDRPYDGVVGLALFRDHLLTIDYKRDLVIISRGELPEANGKEVLAYKDMGGHVVIPANFDGVGVGLTFASSAPDAFVLADSLKEKIPLAPGATVHERRDPRLAGPVLLGQYEILRGPVRFSGVDSAVGFEILKRFAVTIDQKNHRVRFARTSKERIAFHRPGPKFGLTVAKSGASLTVVHVAPGSPAARSGIAVDDVLQYINGFPVRRFDIASFEELMTTAERIDFKVKRGRFDLFVVMVAERQPD